MKRLVSLIFICALLAGSLSTALAVEEDGPNEPTATAASGALYRAQLRLSELGYLSTPVTGLDDSAYQAALTMFGRINGLEAEMDSEADALTQALELLFSSAARPAPYRDAAISTGRGLDEAPFSAGLSLDWQEIAPRLEPEVSYTLTSCASGIVFYMRYLEGDGHAEMSPVLAWDDATLFSLLDGEGSPKKMPVVIALGGLRVAASIQLNPSYIVEDGNMHRYCLYFHGSTSDFVGLTDAEHEHLIAYASGALTGSEPEDLTEALEALSSPFPSPDNASNEDAPTTTPAAPDDSANDDDAALPTDDSD